MIDPEEVATELEVEEEHLRELIARTSKQSKDIAEAKRALQELKNELQENPDPPKAGG